MTLSPFSAMFSQVISTHTSRVGCDVGLYHIWTCRIYFYSHIPCGMWRYFPTVVNECEKFLLTHPVWDVTANIIQTSRTMKISTHTSRVGCDCNRQECGRADHISTHTSRVGCDSTRDCENCKYNNFYSHIPCGMWPMRGSVGGLDSRNFYSHIPCGMWHFDVYDKVER